MPGRTTIENSIWPQGCGMYQAAVKSGAMFLVGLAVNAVAEHAVPATATPVQTPPSVPARPGPVGRLDDGVSEATMPAGVRMSVSGVSADTENAPGQPHGANGIV